MPPKAQITIIGLGLIGTSLGLALKRAGGNFDIVGHDREPEAAARARKRGAVDQTAWNLIAAVENADIILLAIPISAVEATLEAIASDLKEGCIILDTCTIKRPVLEWAERILPAHVSFIGGNPIPYQPLPAAAGAEGASETLFDKSLFCLCPSPRATAEAVQLAADMVSALGAQPYFLDAEEHDGLIAGVELLPLAMAGALMETAARSPGWREITRLADEIEALGPVNLAALEELESAKERKGFLDEQSADLATAIGTLEDAIRRMTSLPASRAGLKGRGRVAKGCWADLVVLDPESVSDLSSYDD
ncbi:MAG: prephenate dehydrogenase/arogenate dehydrogenase family protein, partial [Anaerolineae bacterium]